MKTIEIVYVSMICSEEKKEEFGTYLQEIANDVREIKGCIKFDYLISPEKQNRFIAYVEFDSKESHQRYKSSNAINKINSLLFPLLIDSPKFRHYSAGVIQTSDN